jgi:hypothetical protein
VPLHAEERLIDFLLAQTDATIEFSMHTVAARGPLVHMQPGQEQVRGYATRVEAKLILPQHLLPRLMPGVQCLLAGTDGGWWITRVVSVGQFSSGERLPVSSSPMPLDGDWTSAGPDGVTLPSALDDPLGDIHHRRRDTPAMPAVMDGPVDPSDNHDHYDTAWASMLRPCPGEKVAESHGAPPHVAWPGPGRISRLFKLGTGRA